MLWKILGLALISTLAAAQVSRDGEGFRLAVPGYRYQFPRDHGAHFDYRLEWWYYTGHLTTESHKDYGFEVTFFRVGVASPQSPASTQWDLRHLGLAHFALSDIGRREFRYHQKINRLVPYLAEASMETLRVFNESWRVELQTDGSMRLRADAKGDAVDLILRPQKPPVIHGRDGISVKAAGTGYASHYYSMTRLEVTGTVRSKGRREPCHGIAWMDHEFSSSTLRENQAGWDWFSIQLDDHTELMLYQMRKRDGSPDENSSGTFIAGETTYLDAGDFEIVSRRQWKSPRSGATYPMGWTVRVPSLDLQLELTERLQDQELITPESTRVTYWEGAVTASGTSRGKSVRGVGYVEMSGYDRPLTLSPAGRGSRAATATAAPTPTDSPRPP